MPVKLIWNLNWSVCRWVFQWTSIVRLSLKWDWWHFIIFNKWKLPVFDWCEDKSPSLCTTQFLGSAPHVRRMSLSTHSIQNDRTQISNINLYYNINTRKTEGNPEPAVPHPKPDQMRTAEYVYTHYESNASLKSEAFQCFSHTLLALDRKPNIITWIRTRFRLCPVNGHMW